MASLSNSQWRPSLSLLLEGNVSLLASYLLALPPLPEFITGDWHLIVSEDSRMINNTHRRWKHTAPLHHTDRTLWSPAALIFPMNLPSLAPKLHFTQALWHVPSSCNTTTKGFSHRLNILNCVLNMGAEMVRWHCR